MFSLWVLNGKEGVFSVGGICAVRKTNGGRKEGQEVERELRHGDTPAVEQLPNTKGKEIKHQETRRENLERRMVRPASYSKEKTSAVDWRWNKLQGPEGWWQTMMSGLWIDGRKVLQNQPIVLDINTPFILAPPVAARTFYTSISGSRRLPVPYDQFYAYPCLNSPQIHFEFGQDWKVQVLKGKRDKGTFSPGGRFSLGRISMGSGYCVGIVVESRMGMKKSQNEDGNDLEDFWVLGEPFFRDCQVAFDWKEKKIGMQRL